MLGLGVSARPQPGQIVRRGVDEQQRVVAYTNLSGGEQAAAQPGIQRRRRHIQFTRQAAYRPFVRLMLRRRSHAMPSATQTLSDHERLHHAGAKGLAAFGRAPAFGIEHARNGRAAVALRNERRHALAQLRVVAGPPAPLAA